MQSIKLPATYNYTAAFLTLACNLDCSYCINVQTLTAYGGRKLMKVEDWITGLNRLEMGDVPITLQGGEPTTRKGWERIVQEVDAKFDILTNIQFDPQWFIDNIPIEKVTRDAPYAMIRVSYHPEQMQLDPMLTKVQTLQDAGYKIGVWGVLHPSQEKEILEVQRIAKEIGIDFRTKEFLGWHEGKEYGTLKYKDACDFTNKADRIPIYRNVSCKTTELLIGPNGHIYRCHSDLYEGRAHCGHILDEHFKIYDDFRGCYYYGTCSPCDVKVTTNRFQEHGHTSVEIEF